MLNKNTIIDIFILKTYVLVQKLCNIFDYDYSFSKTKTSTLQVNIIDITLSIR